MQALDIGMSLNDCTHQGPSLQQDIVKILTRFRKNRVAIICDIAEMYMNIEISNEDRKFFDSCGETLMIYRIYVFLSSIG